MSITEKHVTFYTTTDGANFEDKAQAEQAQAIIDTLKHADAFLATIPDPRARTRSKNTLLKFAAFSASQSVAVNNAAG